MKKVLRSGIVFTCVAALLFGCGQQVNNTPSESTNIVTAGNAEEKRLENATAITLSDEEITIDGEAASRDESAAVYIANDIVFYLADQGFTYGEGTEADEHTQEEADEHTVVHITEPGTYEISGKLSVGQIAVDLGEDAEEDPDAVVTLVLNGVDINCSVAPAVIFYNVYECGDSDAEAATKDVDTSAAGANVVIADGSVNNVTGSYVARIYKSYELNEAGTEVVDNKKLHKYDGAFYSKMSMNVDGGNEGTGVLNIVAENEGLDSELHLTIKGGNVHITSGNDGINTNEDGVSVTTINGGTLTIRVDGSTGEGDGIDSNGWLVINGGTVISAACSTSGDAGIDSDMGIHINGGTVLATGNMLDRISESEQNFTVFSFGSRQSGGNNYVLKTEAGDVVAEVQPENDFTYLIIASDTLTAGNYTLWQDNTQLAASKSDGNSGMGGGMHGGFSGGEKPEGKELPEGMELPENMERPEGMQKPESGQGRGQNGGIINNAETSTDFIMEDGGNYFNFVTAAE